MDIFIYILIGIVFGCIGGMGMGGGIILIPFLTIFMGFNQQDAQAINLFAFVPMAILALIMHIKNKLINISQTWVLLISGSIFAFLGSYVASLLSGETLKTIFGIFLITVAISRGVTAIKERRDKT